MPPFSRHVLRFPSPVDRREIPYVVSVPVATNDGDAVAPAEKVPILVCLHDRLKNPTADGFLDTALVTAKRWESALAGALPALLVQPYGRGNAGWLNAAARDLAALFERLVDEFPQARGPRLLVGIGSGGTGALQLASRAPDAYAAVAAFGPWTGWNESSSAGASDRMEEASDDSGPAWELPQRAAVAPLTLVGNLAALPIYLEHPWWYSGLHEPGAEHTDRLADRLTRAGGAVKIAQPAGLLGLRREIPDDLPQVVTWLATQAKRTPSRLLELHDLGPGEASSRHLQVLGVRDPAAPAHLTFESRRRAVVVRTKNVTAFAVDSALLAPWDLDPAEPWKIDRATVPPPVPEGDDRIGAPEVGWLRFERLGREWVVLPADSEDLGVGPGMLASPGPREQSGSAGGMSGMLTTQGFSPSASRRFATTGHQGSSPLAWQFFARPGHKGLGPYTGRQLGDRPLLFVPGTLSDEVGNHLQRETAEYLCARWNAGLDSSNPYPGDRRPDLLAAVRADVAVSESDWADCHVVAIGQPGTNLLLARVRGSWPARWEEPAEDSGLVPITFGHHRLADPSDILWMIAPNPEHLGCCFAHLSPVRLAALGSLRGFRLAFLPTWLHYHQGRPAHWGLGVPPTADDP